jgi:hypothetical protein
VPPLDLPPYFGTDAVEVPTNSGLRESLDALESLIADGESARFGTRYDTEILAALRELQARRRGGFLWATAGYLSCWENNNEITDGRGAIS